MKWLAQLKDSGVNVKALKDIPEISPYARWLWDAFHTLSDKRRTTSADGPQPIPVSEIMAYADYHAIPPGALRDDLLFCVGEMDKVFVQFVMKKRQEAQRKADRKSRNARHAPARRTRFPRRRK